MEWKVSVLVLLHHSAVFDTIDHKTVQYTVEQVGNLGEIKWNSLKMVQFLCRGKELLCDQRKFESDRMATKCGVPQGSMLGPLLFSLHIVAVL